MKFKEYKFNFDTIVSVTQRQNKLPFRVDFLSLDARWQIGRNVVKGNK